MRPVQLTMSAFGPYAETEVIDFTKLEGRSMFVVSGRTGAGKTTIFDAMTFALYGRASGVLRNPSDFRSQYASPEQKTEVDFSFTIREKLYRVVRQPQQPHPKNKTPIPHEAVLYEWDANWKPVATKVNEVQEKIEDILQLSYEQFSQILLLPQNQFRQLLDSDSMKKQQILQSIFKTEAYRSFQENWADRHSKYRKQVEWAVERTRLKLLELEDDAIEAVAEQPIEEVLTWLDEREKTLAERVGTLDQEKQDTAKRLETVRQTVEESNRVLRLFEERDASRERLATFKAGESARSSRRELLKQLEAANHVRPSYERMTESVRLVDQLTKASIESAKQLSRLKERQANLVSNQDVMQRMKKELDVHLERLRVIEELLPHLDERTKLITERQRLREQADLRASFDQETRLGELQQQETKLLQELEQAPAERAVDKERELDRLRSLYKLEQKQNELTERLTRCEQNGKHVQKRHQTQLDVVANFERAERRIWAKRISETLVEGEPCPVCGSLHHEITPHQEAAEDLVEQEQAVERLKELEGRLYEARAEYRSILQQLEEAKQEFEVQAKEIHVEGSLKEMIEQLQARVTTLQQAESDRMQKERTARQIAAEIKRLEQLKREQFEERQNLLKRVDSIQERLAEIGQMEDGSLQDFKDEQRKLSEQVRQLEQTVTGHEKELEDVNKATWKEEERNTLYEEQLREATSQLNKTRAAYSEKLEEQKLTDEMYRKFADRIDELSAMREQLQREEEEGLRLTHTLQSIEEKLGDIEKPDLTAVTEQLRQVNEQYEHTSKELVTATSALSRHRQIVTEWTKLRAETAEEEKKLETIKLIADTGKGFNPQKMTFETYVQTAFFDQILHAANIHLDQMTSGQFRLERKMEMAKGNAKSGLELLVFDAYTGQTRRVQNLSGGEGFKASLSLALGLAEVVQQLSGGVSLETMLIDEGFGTLDAESLDQAIELLMSLQSSGRLVGVISHVQELKDRVDARIEVKKSRSGSTIQLIVE